CPAWSIGHMSAHAPSPTRARFLAWSGSLIKFGLRRRRRSRELSIRTQSPFTACPGQDRLTSIPVGRNTSTPAVRSVQRLVGRGRLGERVISTLNGSSQFPFGRGQSIQTALPKICFLWFIRNRVTTPRSVSGIQYGKWAGKTRGRIESHREEFYDE